MLIIISTRNGECLTSPKKDQENHVLSQDKARQTKCTTKMSLEHYIDAHMSIRDGILAPNYLKINEEATTVRFLLKGLQGH